MQEGLNFQQNVNVLNQIISDMARLNVKGMENIEKHTKFCASKVKA